VKEDEMSEPTTEAGRRLQEWLRSIGSFGPSFDLAIAAIEAEARASLDVDALARAVTLEVHVDEAHGFPPGFTADALAALIAREYRTILAETDR
jgi:hypothetical protein